VPIVKTLADRVQKFSVATAPDRVGTRYGAVKDLALARYGDGASVIATVREMARNVLVTAGVPPAQQGVYFAFAMKLASKAMSHTGPALDKVIDGLKAWFVAKGADPAILDKLAKLVA